MKMGKDSKVSNKLMNLNKNCGKKLCKDINITFLCVVAQGH